jgi:hypothetical protein
MRPHARSNKGQVRDAPNNTDKRLNPTGRFLLQKATKPNPGEAHMSMVMFKCPQTERAIPTGIKSDRESFRRSPVFFGRTHCPICQVDHAWFAQEAWVDEPNAWARRRSAGSLA